MRADRRRVGTFGMALFLAFMFSLYDKVYAVQYLPAEHYFPDYNSSPAKADSAGMGSTAMQLAAKMKLGWNIGNTLDAVGGETAWGNPKVTRELIMAVKNSGFNAIRIPCNWDQYADQATAEIKEAWLSRVKEVVQYCVDNDMYVVLNIHWDGGWLESNCTPDKRAAVNARQKAYWEQIATYLRNFDEHLIFASANEPSVKNAEQMDVLFSYHQTFINAVRSTGGKNAYRVLVIQGPSTDIEKTIQLMPNLPADKVKNKLMVEVHAYAPYRFALMTHDENWGKPFYYWGHGYHSVTDTLHNATGKEEAEIDEMVTGIKNKFVARGIPVIVGEFGVIRRSTLTGDDLSLHLKSRAYFLKYFVQKAKANGLVPFYWDEGSLWNNSFGLFNRRTNTVADKQALDALISGAN